MVGRIGPGFDVSGRLCPCWRLRLEDGKVHFYRDRAVRIDNGDSLAAGGMLQLESMPDKGDLFVHTLHIRRNGETIDLLAVGE